MRDPAEPVDGEGPPRAYDGGRAFKRAEPSPPLERVVPVSHVLPRYRGRALQRDVLAALTVAALAIPAGMAYAEVAGLDPIIGLYALLAPAVLYSLFGSSRQLIVGPEGSLAALVGAAVLAMATAGSPEAGELAATLALLVAGCYALARVLRIGWIADYLSRPVLVGYIHGVAIVLVIGQLGKLLGVSVAATEPLPQLVEVVREIPDASGTTVLVSLAALAVLIPARYILPKLPVALLVVVGGIVASTLLDLASHGVAVVGEIPAGLPRPKIPTPPIEDVLALIPAAAGLFLVSFADEILTARTFAGRHKQHIGVGQELVAMSAASVAAGLTQGMPVGASGSRTAVNDAMGARSQVAGLIGAGVIALVLLFLTAPIADLPKAVLGAVIVSACLGLLDVPAWRELWRTDRVELSIAAATLIGVVVVGVLPAIGFAVAFSLVDVVRRSAHPHDAVLGWVEQAGRWADVAVHPSAQITPGIVVYRLDDRLFFANAGYVKGRVREALRASPEEVYALVFDAEGVSYIDTAGMSAVADLVAELGGDGITLYVARAKSPLRAAIDTPGVEEGIPPENFYPTVRAAVEAAQRGG